MVRTFRGQTHTATYAHGAGRDLAHMRCGGVNDASTGTSAARFLALRKKYLRPSLWSPVRAAVGLTARDRSLVSGRSIAGPLTDARPTRAADARKPTQRAGRFRGTARSARVRHYCKRECARRSVMLAVCLCGRQRAEAHSRPRREQVMKRSGSREHRACSSRSSHGAEPALQRSARPLRHQCCARR